MLVVIQILSIIGIVMLLAGTLATFIWKLDNVSLSDILREGSSITGQYDRFIKPNYIQPIKYLNYIGMSCILVSIVGLVTYGI